MPERSIVLRSRRIITPEGLMDGEVAVTGGRIASVSAPTPATGAVDLGEHWLAPGLIDTHVHGGGGSQFNTAAADEVTAAARFHAANGTTTLLATLLPAHVEELCASLEAIAEADAPNIVGAHLEGPFLSPAQPGALDRAAFLHPDPDVLARLLDAVPGLVRMMTLAPELPGATTIIEALRAAGAVASLGHSDATYDEAVAAIDAGARSVTHMFNAMRPLHHRAPGLLGAALDRPELSCELIADGFHVDPVALRLAHRVRGSGGIRLVTDAIAATGMPDGSYRLGAREVSVVDGQARVHAPDDGGRDAPLAGSTLTIDAAVANAVRFLDVDVPSAVALASARPAELLGLAEHKGAITPGFDADFVVLDDRLRASGTMLGGTWLSTPTAV